jgi:hypothetical protein
VGSVGCSIPLGLFVAVEPGVTVKKPKRSWRRLFQAAVEIIKKMLPKATLIDFLNCGSFHRLPLPNRFFLFAPFSFFVKKSGSTRQIVAPGSLIDDDR